MATTRSVTAALCLAGSASMLFAQPGYMHQRQIGNTAREMYRDAVPTPIDALTPDDFGCFTIGSIQAATTAPGDVLLARHRPDGSVIWARRFDGLSNEQGYKGAIVQNGNYIGVFTTTAPANMQTGLMEVTPLGNLVGIPRIFRGTGATESVQDRDVGVSIRVVDNDFRMITANFSQGTGIPQQGVIIRTDAANNPIWVRRYIYPTPSPSVSFADITMIPATPPVTFPTYVVVGTMTDVNGTSHSILVLRIDPSGAVQSGWSIGFPVGFPAHLYGDGIEYIRGQQVVISAHLRPTLTNPASVVAVTLVFNPLTGALSWVNSFDQFFPGRAAVDWRPEEGALVGGEWRQPVGASFVPHPMLLLTDGAGATFGASIHTNSTDARYDSATIFNGMFGKRILASGWGTFSPTYGMIDALLTRANNLGSTPGCPETALSTATVTAIQVSPRGPQWVDDPASTFLQGPFNPEPLRDDFVCRASPCDPIDFNNDGLFPDTQDLDDFLSVFSGGPCSTGMCKDLDFNNDTLFPDTADIDSILSVFSGGPCL